MKRALEQITGESFGRGMCPQRHPPPRVAWRHNKPEILEQALAHGYSVVLSPRSPCYFDYPQDPSYPPIGWKRCNSPESVYAGPEIPAALVPAQRERILGVEACVWTERIGTVPYLEFMLLPRLAALGESAWTPDAHRDYAQFSTRLKPFLAQYRRSGIAFYDEKNPESSRREARAAGASPPAASLLQ